MSAPRRLLDDPAAPDALRDDLRVAAESEPRYDAERGLLALQAALVTLGHGAPLIEGARQAASSAGHAASQATSQASAAGQAAGAGQAAAAAKVGGVLTGVSASKLTIAAVATALGLAGTVAWLNGEPEAPATRPAPAAVAPAAAHVPAPVPAPELAAPAAAAGPASAEVPAPVDAAPAETEPAAEAEPAAAPRAMRPRHVAPAAPVDSDLALRREIDHLARVRALLVQDPKAAYALAQAGNRTLSSMFRQERDGLSVLALDAAGEHARARRLARQFLARNPNSPLHERIEQLLEPAAEKR